MDLKKAYLIFCSCLFFTFKALALSYTDPVYWDLLANSFESDAQAKLSDRETTTACEYMLLPESEQEEELSNAISNCLSKSETWQDLSLEELRQKCKQTLAKYKKTHAKTLAPSAHVSQEEGYGDGSKLKWLGQVPEYESPPSAIKSKGGNEKETFLGQVPMVDEESTYAAGEQEEFGFDRRAKNSLLDIIEAEEHIPQCYQNSSYREDANPASMNGFDGDDRLW